MKKIGIIGGMSWESTTTYYKVINDEIKNALGGLHSAPIIMSSVDFDGLEKMQHQNKWDEIAEILTKEAKILEGAGAEFIIICSNTMHKVEPQVRASINIPILHITNATAEELKKRKVKRVALLGTKFTMDDGFYTDILKNEFGVNAVVPNEEEQEFIHNVVYGELCLGVVKKESRSRFLEIVKRLEKEEDAQGVILGCTEIDMLVKPGYVDIEVYDSTLIHAKEAAKKILS